MTNQQYKILSFAYNRPRTLSEINKHVIKLSAHDFKGVYSELVDDKLRKLTEFDENYTDWMNSELSLNKYGVALVQSHRKELLWKWVPYAITTAIALAAFIKSFSNEIKVVISHLI